MKKLLGMICFLTIVVLNISALQAASSKGNTGDDSFIIGKKLNINLEDLVENGFDPVNGTFELKVFLLDLAYDYTNHVVAKYENGALVVTNNTLPTPKYLDDFSRHRQRKCDYSKTEGIQSAWGGFYVKFNDKTFILGSFSPNDPPGYVYVMDKITEKCEERGVRTYVKGWNLAGGKIGEIPLSLVDDKVSLR